MSPINPSTLYLVIYRGAESHLVPVSSLTRGHHFGRDIPFREAKKTLLEMLRGRRDVYGNFLG